MEGGEGNLFPHSSVSCRSASSPPLFFCFCFCFAVDHSRGGVVRGGEEVGDRGTRGDCLLTCLCASPIMIFLTLLFLYLADCTVCLHHICMYYHIPPNCRCKQESSRDGKSNLTSRSIGGSTSAEVDPKRGRKLRVSLLFFLLAATSHFPCVWVAGSAKAHFSKNHDIDLVVFEQRRSEGK